MPDDIVTTSDCKLRSAAIDSKFMELNYRLTHTDIQRNVARETLKEERAEMLEKLNEIAEETRTIRIKVMGNGHPEGSIAYNLCKVQETLDRHIQKDTKGSERLWIIAMIPISIIISQVVQFLLTGIK